MFITNLKRRKKCNQCQSVNASYRLLYRAVKAFRRGGCDCFVCNIIAIISVKESKLIQARRQTPSGAKPLSNLKRFAGYRGGAGRFRASLRQLGSQWAQWLSRFLMRSTARAAISGQKTLVVRKGPVPARLSLVFRSQQESSILPVMPTIAANLTGFIYTRGGIQYPA